MGDNSITEGAGPEKEAKLMRYWSRRGGIYVDEQLTVSMRGCARAWPPEVDSQQPSWCEHDARTPNNKVGVGTNESGPGRVSKNADKWQ